MSKRIKHKTGVGQMPRAQMEELVSAIRELTISHQTVLAEKNAELKKLDEQFNPRLTAWAEEIQAKSVLVQAWAEANPDEFTKRKSLELSHGTIGFRTGTPKLKTLAKRTWAAVLDILRAHKPYHGFVRIKEEVDKESILVAHANFNLLPGDLKEMGVEVVQEESFYIEPKLELAEVAK